MDRSVLWISDFDKCVPEDAVSWTREPGKWLLRPYEAGSKKGVMLTAEAKNIVPEVIYPLNLEGWYSIWVAVYSPDQRLSVFDIRLTSDEASRSVSTCAYLYEPYGWIMEGLLKHADLTNQQIIISKDHQHRAYLAYIKLVPISEEQVAEVRREQEQQETKICGGVFDVGELFSEGPPYTPNIVKRSIDPFIGTDFKKICWGTTWSTYTYLYHTKIGDVFGYGKKTFYFDRTKNCAELMAASLREGWDPLRIAVEYAHRNGLEIYADYRMDHTYDLGMYNDDATGRFQRENQHLRCITKDGRFICHLSHAYPEVNAYKIAALREQAEYGVDGVYLDFMRGPPYLLYEPPLVEGFKEKTGEDPRELDNNDPRWLKYRAGFMTQFMRDLRRELNKVGKNLGKKMEIVAQVGYGIASTPDPHCNLIDINLVYGLDLKVWIDEGLIDILAPSNSRIYTNLFLDHIKPLLKGKKCQLWPVVGPFDLMLFPDDYDWLDYFKEVPMKMIPHLDARRLLRLANDLYNQGADGIFVWEMGGVPSVLPRWNILKGIGHKKELAKEFGTHIGRIDGEPLITERKVKFLEKRD